MKILAVAVALVVLIALFPAGSVWRIADCHNVEATQYRHYRVVASYGDGKCVLERPNTLLLALLEQP